MICLAVLRYEPQINIFFISKAYYKLSISLQKTIVPYKLKFCMVGRKKFSVVYRLCNRKVELISLKCFISEGFNILVVGSTWSILLIIYSIMSNVLFLIYNKRVQHKTVRII